MATTQASLTISVYSRAPLQKLQVDAIRPVTTRNLFLPLTLGPPDSFMI